MAAKVVTFCNQKGGCGKTSLSMQVAGGFARRGFRTLIVDADPQGTATRWSSAAPDDTPFPATVAGLSAAGGKVHREVQKFIDDYDLIVVDCPPAVDSPVPQSALMVSDLAFVPVIPSPTDLWAAVGIRDLIQRTQDVNEGLQARLVPNMVQPNTTLAKEALDLLADFGIPTAKGTFSLRTAYRQAAVYGSTVHALKDQKAIDEVEALVTEALDLLGMPKRAPKAVKRASA